MEKQILMNQLAIMEALTNIVEEKESLRSLKAQIIITENVIRFTV